jgi:hypothetical protein
LYAVFMKDYPWLSTRPGACKQFEYVKLGAPWDSTVKLGLVTGF